MADTWQPQRSQSWSPGEPSVANVCTVDAMAHLPLFSMTSISMQPGSCWMSQYLRATPRRASRGSPFRAGPRVDLPTFGTVGDTV